MRTPDLQTAPPGVARKPKDKAAEAPRPTLTLASCHPLEAEAASADAYIAPWTVVELHKQFQHTLANPPQAHVEEVAALSEADFPAQLYAA